MDMQWSHSGVHSMLNGQLSVYGIEVLAVFTLLAVAMGVAP
jgi:hypothetical protein